MNSFQGYAILSGMTKKTNPRKDFTQIAFDVFRRAIGEAEPEEDMPGKKADSQKGGLKGERARAEKLTPEEVSKHSNKN
jgi:hypothetical protein